tara:strand:- start:188 stop:1321 length:1134 start_codon:yes stop_codon:yes gene_type:complete
MIRQKACLTRELALKTDGSRPTFAEKIKYWADQKKNIEAPPRPPHPDGDLFDSFLANYQEDFRRIIFKFKGDFHHLMADEILSEVNLALVRKRDEILYSIEGEITKSEFGKIAYRYTRNIIKWSHGRIAKVSYVKRRDDGSYLSEDGWMTAFDKVCNTQGYEDKGFESFDKDSKVKYILKLIYEYSHILSKKEISYLELAREGYNLRESAKIHGVTHQAVSISLQKAADKIKAYLNFDFAEDNSPEKVVKGRASINGFFEKRGDKFSDEDREELKEFLLSHRGKYNCKEISLRFKGGKYSNRQIAAVAIKNGFSSCIFKAKKSSHTKKEELKIINLFTKGLSSREVSIELGVDFNFLRGKLGHWRRQGIVPLRSDSL